MNGTPVGSYTFKADVDAARPGNETVFVNVALNGGAFTVTASVLGDAAADEDALKTGGQLSGGVLGSGTVAGTESENFIPVSYDFGDASVTSTAAPEQPQNALSFQDIDGNLYTVSLSADGVTATKSFEQDMSIDPNNRKLTFPSETVTSPVAVKKIN